MAITKEQLEEYLYEISDDLDEGNLDKIYQRNDPRNEWLTDELYYMGIDPLDGLPWVLNHIAEMELAIQPEESTSYNGATLDWLIEGFGSSAYRYLYLYQFKHNPIFKCERLEKRYSWCQDNDNDYYICLAQHWDIDKFKEIVDGK